MARTTIEIRWGGLVGRNPAYQAEVTRILLEVVTCAALGEYGITFSSPLTKTGPLLTQLTISGDVPEEFETLVQTALTRFNVSIQVLYRVTQ